MAHEKILTDFMDALSRLDDEEDVRKLEYIIEQVMSETREDEDVKLLLTTGRDITRRVSKSIVA